MNKHPTIHCPTCRKHNTWQLENAFRPFCSERCKRIDLGEWASETRKIAGEPVDPTGLPDGSYGLKDPNDDFL